MCFSLDTRFDSHICNGFERTVTSNLNANLIFRTELRHRFSLTQYRLGINYIYGSKTLTTSKLLLKINVFDTCGRYFFPFILYYTIKNDSDRG